MEETIRATHKAFHLVCAKAMDKLKHDNPALTEATLLFMIMDDPKVIQASDAFAYSFNY